ncbi:MAG: hypothetical protein DA328_09415 [Nitrososphaeraceae archaeon]|nr:hypothetical protein [Nitrososphaeraceae archaeon]
MMILYVFDIKYKLYFNTLYIFLDLYFYQLNSDLFYDNESKILFREISTKSSVKSRVLLNIEKFEIGQSYVTAKIINRYQDKITINIQGGKPGIELQKSLFKIDDDATNIPKYAFLFARLLNTDEIFVRKLPVIGFRDWLLIFEDKLVELSVKDAYDELEITLV